ncbi:hypothetical protein LY474_33225 [Myxococcus stipitatus]|uniref:hypothetical protein n=1 Tax=Myxococcus stipitatus TaxID=83455 RepID=UPI001F4712C2|nr:hypothetical protein [Myxococcus stipitatus]MCE9672682.1 hypothetical protein [Myxococcus stipitatus]
MELPLKQRLRLFPLLIVLIGTAARAEAPRPVEASTRLYLLAEGMQSAIPERYLRHLCDLIREDPTVRAHYKSVSVYRYTPDLGSITGKFMASVANRATPDAQALTELSELMNREEHRCWGTPLSAGNITDDTVELLRLEWIGGSMAGELRAQRVTVLPSPAPREAPSGKKPPVPREKPPSPRVEPPEYISTQRDARDLARALGLRFLPIKPEDVFTSQVTAAIPASSQCKAIQADGEHCVLLGEPLRLSLVVKSSLWVHEKEVQPTWRAICQNSAGHTLGANAVHVEDPHGRDTTARVVERGRCRFEAELRAHGIGHRASLPTEFTFDAGPVLSRLSSELVIMSRTRFEETLRERRILPFVTSTTNHENLTKAIFAGLVIVSPESVLQFGRHVREDLLTLGARTDVPEYKKKAEHAFVTALDSFGETLGQQLLTSRGRYHETVEIGNTRMILSHERLCQELNAAMGRTWEHEQAHSLNSDWVYKCQAIIIKHRHKLASTAMRTSNLLIRRNPTAQKHVYRLALGLQENDFVQMDGGGQVFTDVLPKGYRSTEEYSIHGVTDAGSQSSPVMLRVNVARRTPSLGIAPSIDLATNHGGHGVGAGQGVWLFTYILDEIIRVEGGGSVMVLSRDAFNSDQVANFIRAQVSGSMNLACLLGRTIRPPSYCDAVLALGAGYEFTHPYPFLQLRVGMKLSDHPWMLTPELVIEAPQSHLEDGVIFRAAVNVSPF